MELSVPRKARGFIPSAASGNPGRAVPLPVRAEGSESIFFDGIHNGPACRFGARFTHAERGQTHFRGEATRLPRCATP